jgi:glycogen operon protein
MTRHDWEDGEPSLGLFLNGAAIPSPGPHGEAVHDDSFLLLFNSCAEPREFRLPRSRMGEEWALELSTADPDAPVDGARWRAHTVVDLAPHSMLVLRRVA